MKEDGCGGKTIKSSQTYVGFQCKLRPLLWIVFCGFKHSSDKISIIGSHVTLAATCFLYWKGVKKGSWQKNIAESLCKL